MPHGIAKTPQFWSRRSSFQRKTVRKKLTGREFTQEQVAAAKDWAAQVRHPNFRKAKETSVRDEFIQTVFVTVLGYTPYRAGETFTIATEEALGKGAVDRALGTFSLRERIVLAPFELKGPKTHDLDAIMPGRNKSPVQQAWEYAIDAPGAKWVLVSNCAEIRLYAFGHGREHYETWDLQFLDEPTEHERLWLFLGMENLLDGRTAALLEESANEQKVITKKLYVLYKESREKLIQTLKDQPPHLAPLTAIEHAQTILDRVLFIAFAEKNSLLPPRQIRKAWRETSEFSPNSAWQNFVGLFEAVDKGKPKLDIPAYNGGLFAKNPIIDALSLPYYVCEYFDKIADYDFATEVPVSVLGHIFEQSVSDTEKERAEAQGEAPPKTTKRKRDGVVYTPDFVTRFIVEETIGNPPYVRQETIKPFKSYLNRHYSSYHSSLDLYGYFYELALRISKNGGRIGFISSYSFLKTSSARDLRRFLIIHSNLETFVDFGDIKVFDDVTTYPVIITANKAQTIINSDIKFTNLRNLLPDDLHASFLRNHDTMASTDLSLDAWHFESADLRLLRRKICNNSPSLSGEFGHPKNGIKTGLTSLFELSIEEFEVLRGQISLLDQQIKPFLVGDNIEKWSPEAPDQFIIRIEKGWTRRQIQTDDESTAWNRFASLLPQVAPRFLLHKDKAMARSDQGDFWWELRPCDYYSEFDKPKICIPEMSQGPKFARDNRGYTLNNKVFFLPYFPELIGYMNSRLAWFYLFGRCAQLRGGKWRLELREQYISTLPIPAKGLGHDPSLAFQSSLAADAADSRTQKISTFLRRVPDLCPPDRKPKLTTRLREWWNLDFKSFRAEIKKAFKADIPLKQRNDWENFLREEGEKVRRLTAEIEQAEREIDAIVYKLFDLTPNEIALLESSLAGQY